MGISERKEREKKELREKIVDAATKLFLDYGFEKTSIRMIADNIEYSPATIYLHFKDKNELFYIIMERAFGTFFSYLSEVRNVADPVERLQRLGEKYMKFSNENPEYYYLMFINSAPMMAHEHEKWDPGKRSHEILTSTVKECIESGHFKGHNADELSLMIWSTVHGLSAFKIRNRMSMYDEEIREKMEKGALASFNEIIAGM